MARGITMPIADGNILDAVGAGPIRIKGWSVRIDANAATIDLKQGGSSGQIIATINLAASGGSTIWFDGEGLVCGSDILYADLTGTTTGLIGTIFIA